MILDQQLQFSAAQAVTTTADSANQIDMGSNRDMGIGAAPLTVLVLAATSFTSGTAAATLTVRLLGAPDNGSGAEGVYNTIAESGALPLGRLTAGQKIAQFPLPPVANGFSPFARSQTTAVVSASTSVPIVSAAGLSAGLFVSAVGIIPGTTIASISSNTLTLSNAATIAAGADVNFSPSPPLPRFYKLAYVVSNTMTAGSVNSFLAGSVDTGAYYQGGIP
jgi:hypothetical protein